MKIIAILPEYLLHLPKMRQWFGDEIVDALQWEDLRLDLFNSFHDMQQLFKTEEPNVIVLFGEVARVCSDRFSRIGVEKVFVPHPKDANLDVPRKVEEAAGKIKTLLSGERLPADTFSIKQREPALPALALNNEDHQSKEETYANTQQSTRSPAPTVSPADYYPDCEEAQAGPTGHNSWLDKSLPPEPQDGDSITIDPSGRAIKCANSAESNDA